MLLPGVPEGVMSCFNRMTNGCLKLGTSRDSYCDAITGFIGGAGLSTIIQLIIDFLQLVMKNISNSCCTGAVAYGCSTETGEIGLLKLDEVSDVFITHLTVQDGVIVYPYETNITFEENNILYTEQEVCKYLRDKYGSKNSTCTTYNSLGYGKKYNTKITRIPTLQKAIVTSYYSYHLFVTMSGEYKNVIDALDKNNPKNKVALDVFSEL